MKRKKSKQYTLYNIQQQIDRQIDRQIDKERKKCSTVEPRQRLIRTMPYDCPTIATGARLTGLNVASNNDRSEIWCDLVGDTGCILTIHSDPRQMSRKQRKCECSEMELQKRKMETKVRVLSSKIGVMAVHKQLANAAVI